MRFTKRILSLGIALSVVGIPFRGSACTIMSGIDKTKNVWTGNNEDGTPNTATYLNVFPKDSNTRLGYYTLSYHTPLNGANGGIQGGMNEAGLTFDFNALPRNYEVVGLAKKSNFPEGDAAILRHSLGNLETTEAVVAFFEKYWFKNGFRSAQMHVADKHGHFAIIGPSGSTLVTNSPFQVSTNFNIVAKEDSSSCWRFPIATGKLREKGASLEIMIDICKNTAQKQGSGSATLYSNIQNLNTGDVWFFSNNNFDVPYKTDLQTLLSHGRKSYLISDLCKASGAAKP